MQLLSIGLRESKNISSPAGSIEDPRPAKRGFAGVFGDQVRDWWEGEAAAGEATRPLLAIEARVRGTKRVHLYFTNLILGYQHTSKYLQTPRKREGKSLNKGMTIFHPIW